jgi:uncharacterized protein involved in type VI secretion and phage assembly
MSYQPPPPLLASGVVRIDGAELPPELAALLVLLRVRDSLRLPDQAFLRLADPQLAHVDDALLAVGRTVEVLYGAPGATAASGVFSGRIASIELELLHGGAFIAATAYEPAFVLHQQRRTQAFQNMTSGEIAAQVIGAAGLSAALTSSSASEVVHPFVLQSEETDWQLLWRLADAIDFEVVGDGATVHFRPAGSTAPGPPLALRAPEELLCFRPRITAAQQVRDVEVRGWDPANAEAIVANADAPAPDSSPGDGRGAVAAASGAGTWTVGDRTVLSQDEASALAGSLAAQLANAWVEADGVALGDPRLRAGSRVQVSGVGTRFGGLYTLTSTTHVLSGGRGYETHFSISGRATRTIAELLDLATTAPQWGASVVVGVVTQTDDPAGLGRVRVQHPALGENAEGWWARIAAPAAGASRGLLMMPLAGDEVVLAFEQGDPRRPYVLGAVWNGQATPGELVKSDGSFALASDRDIDLAAAGRASIAAQEAMTLEGAKGIAVRAQEKLELGGGAAVVLEADGSVTVKGGDIAVQATGTVQISGAEVLLG